MDLEREKQIGQRLRAFREALQIPRSKFAVTIGIGSERLASYEAGRARLRFGIFKSIHQKYRLLPLWLASERGPLRLLDDHKLLTFPAIPDRMLFSEAFDSYLATQAENEIAEAEKNIRLYRSVVHQWLQVINSPNLSESEREQFLKSVGTQDFVERVLDAIHTARPDLDLGRLIERFSTDAAGGRESKSNLTGKLSVASVHDVTNLWAKLKRRLQSATVEKGKKSDLAKFLKVDLTRVSQWLTEKDSTREPGAGYALAMLQWVEQEEAKQKSPGSATNTTRAEARSTKSEHEKVKSGPRKT